jgi:predicted nucleic acid-binding protein
VRIAFDTNVLAYAEGINGAERRDAALNLIRRLPQEAAVVPVQVLGELFNVLVRKGGKSRSDARDRAVNALVEAADSPIAVTATTGTGHDPDASPPEVMSERA